MLIAEYRQKKQDLQRQIDNICKIYPNAVIYSDKFTGSTFDRPNWNKLYKLLKAGDTIVFDSVSRMSRDAAEGAELYAELYSMQCICTDNSEQVLTMI